MKKKLFIAITCLMMCLFTSIFATGCNGETKEDIVYKIVCEIADDYDYSLSNVTISSGSIQRDESANSYDAWLVAKVYYYGGNLTLYFNAEYFCSNGEITYTLMNDRFGITGPGPLFLKTDSFDISAVNDRLD
ncbi:MAG: hypothetical protein IKW33_00935 [Clostridia bacterium]|nr:hypothetical protein [Clostridia bacterium]